MSKRKPKSERVLEKGKKLKDKKIQKNEKSLESEKPSDKILVEAQAALNSGNWQEAVRLLEPIKDELSVAWQTNLAAAYGNLGEHTKVIELLEPIKGELPPEGKTNLAAAYGSLGKYKEAIELLEPVKNRLDANGRNLLAVAYINSGQFAKVIELLEPIKAELSPESKSYLSFAYLSLGKHAEIIKLLEPHKDELNTEWQIYLAAAYINLGKYKEVVELLKPDKDEFSFKNEINLATAYLRLGQNKKVVDLLEPLKDKPSFKGENNLANAYINLGQFNKAVELLEALKDSNKLRPEFKPNLAVAYSMLGKHDEVIALLKGDNYELPLLAKNTLALAYLYTGKREEATKLVNKSAKALASFITYTLSYLKTMILSNKLAGLMGEEFFKPEIVELFFNHYLKTDLTGNKLSTQQEHLFSQICVLALLKYDNIPSVSHYCNFNTYNPMFDFNNPEHKLRMNEVTSFNDPLEGEMLKYHNVDVSIIEGKKAFIKCFSLRLNNLNQFRLYGGQHGQADGMSLRFNNSFFNPELAIPELAIPKLAFSEGAVSGDVISEKIVADALKFTSLSRLANDANGEQRLSLFRMCYVEAIKESPHYKIHGLATPDITSYLADNPDKKREDYQAEVVEPDLKVMEQLDIFLPKKDEKIYIPYLPYLFKDKAFLDEAECRMIKLEDFTAENLENRTAEDLKQLMIEDDYITYDVEVLEHLAKVDFGPNLEKKTYWQDYFEKRELSVDVNLNDNLLFIDNDRKQYTQLFKLFRHLKVKLTFEQKLELFKKETKNLHKKDKPSS